jgi:hypothetical protein
VYQESSGGGGGVQGGRRVGLASLPLFVSRLPRQNVGASTSHNPIGFHGQLQGQLYFYIGYRRHPVLSVSFHGAVVVKVYILFQYWNFSFLCHINYTGGSSIRLSIVCPDHSCVTSHPIRLCCLLYFYVDILKFSKCKNRFSLSRRLSPSSLAKQPFLSHGLPWKILPDLVQLSLLWISQQYFFLQNKVVSLASNLT